MRAIIRLIIFGDVVIGTSLNVLSVYTGRLSDTLFVLEYRQYSCSRTGYVIYVLSPALFARGDIFLFGYSGSSALYCCLLPVSSQFLIKLVVLRSSAGLSEWR